MKLVRLFLGILMLPLCVAVTRALVTLLRTLHPSTNLFQMPSVLALASGFLIWVMLFVALPRPMRAYILAHELTHALWASVMGAEVLDFKVKADHGSVTISESNVLITLAPYFFPLYTVLVLVLYEVLGLFVDVQRYSLLWLGLVGLTWGFHFTFTLQTLMQRQTDIQAYGHVFSYTTIYMLNLLGIGLWVVMVSPASLEQFVHSLQQGLVQTGRLCLDLWALIDNLRQ